MVQLFYEISAKIINKRFCTFVNDYYAECASKDAFKLFFIALCSNFQSKISTMSLLMTLRKKIFFVMTFIVLVAIIVTIYQKNHPADETKELMISAAALTPSKPYDFEQVQPLPMDIKLPANKVALGRRLFNEMALSSDRTISCASCHQLDKAGTDRKAVSIGINGAEGLFNSPTVFNSGFNFTQFWDGRVLSLEQQASGPIHNPDEMGSNWQEILPRLRADAVYQAHFSKIYPDGISAENVVDAIATYERSLITPNSRFDQYLRGDKNALTSYELKGYHLFKDYGCISCHQGVNIGGNMFQYFGVFDGYFENKTISQSDLGRFNVTGYEDDRYVFKVPSLRNVAVTAPYFHDGSVSSLDSAVVIMGRYQLGRELSEEDTQLLVTFLQTLTGQWQGKTLQ